MPLAVVLFLLFSCFFSPLISHPGFLSSLGLWDDAFQFIHKAVQTMMES